MKPENREFSSRLYRVLEDTRVVTPEDAMFDLCSISLVLPTVTGTESQTLRRLKALSLVTVEVPGSDSQLLFTKRKLEKWRKFHSFQIVGDKKGEGMIFPHPTFSGLLTANREAVPPKNPAQSTSWEILFKVQVSINRAVQAQAITMEHKSKQIRRSDPYALFMSEVNASQVDERLLVPATNILDRSETRQRYAASQSAEEHLKEFILEVSRRCVDAMGASQESVPTVKIDALEVCWDFYDEQPIITVELVKAKALRIVKNLRAKYAPTATVTERLEVNSPSVIVDLIDDLSIRFYAKSDQTVRFEVNYGPKQINKLMNCEGPPSLDNALETARSARVAAAKHMNTVLTLMRQEADENDATPDELYRAVLVAFPDVFEARAILSCLVRHRHIRTFPKDPRLPGLRKLKSLYVLECEPDSPGRRNYVVTPRFEDARRQLVFTQVIPRRFWIKPRPRHLRGREK